MKTDTQFIEANSADPVLREMARTASRILKDYSLTEKQRGELIRRLQAEYHAYKAWNKQYRSYFRTPRTNERFSRTTEGGHRD